MEDYLSYLLTPLLTHPDDLSISSNAGAIFLKVHPEDTGRVIGKHGQIINSLRTLLKTYCALHHLPTVTLSLTTPPKTD